MGLKKIGIWIFTIVFTVIIENLVRKYFNIEIFSFIYNYIISILLFEVPVFKVLIAVLIIIICFLWVIFFTKTERKHPGWYTDFKELEYEGKYYTWKYRKLDNRRYEVVDVRQVCKCRCTLRIGDIFEKSVICPNCKRKYELGNSIDEQRVKDLISFKISEKVRQKNIKT